MDDLVLILKRELETVRQILENLHLEEQFILKRQKKYWGGMMEERELLLRQLEAIRMDKECVIRKLGKSGDNSEVLSLQEQLATLSDRMGLQKSRNNMLKSIAAKSQPKKKIGVATLTREEYKEGDE